MELKHTYSLLNNCLFVKHLETPFTLADIIFHKFLELQSTSSEKEIFVANFPFLMDSLNPPLPQPLNSQNLLHMTKVFC